MDPYDEREAAVSERRSSTRRAHEATQPWSAPKHKPAASACDAADPG